MCNFLYLDNISLNSISSNSTQEFVHNVVYPNPTRGMVYWNGENEIKPDIEVYHMNGKLVKKLNSVREANIEELDAGFYIFKIFYNSRAESIKVIKL